MIDGIKFSRQICDEDPDYVVVVIRAPRGDVTDIYACDCEGEAAQRKATKYVLASAAGMLHTMGACDLAHALAGIGESLEQVWDEKRLNMN